MIVFRHGKCTNNAVGGKIAILKNSLAHLHMGVYPFNCLNTSLKLPNALSKFSAISSTKTSGSGRLSKSASDLSSDTYIQGGFIPGNNLIITKLPPPALRIIN
ncbi:MAG: hypothetical protein ACR2KZ_03465, partial [Segetibacter sp.]